MERGAWEWQRQLSLVRRSVVLCLLSLSTTVGCPFRPCQLPVVRHTEPEYAVGYETRFSDGYPMLLVTSSALEDLNTHLAPTGEQLPMNRFRPNIEVNALQDSRAGVGIE